MNIVPADLYTQMLMTQIRDRSTASEKLKKSITELGKLIGRKIWEDHCAQSSDVETPMRRVFSGVSSRLATTVVISTRDDASYFASGIASIFEGSVRGYMDFSGARGEEALTAPIQAIELPSLSNNQAANLVIIAKSVLATGCTAVTLANKALEFYRPDKLILASTFYSLRGVEEVSQQIYPRPDIYVLGEADSLNNDGMLIPGIGNLDERLSS